MKLGTLAEDKCCGANDLTPGLKCESVCDSLTANPYMSSLFRYTISQIPFVYTQLCHFGDTVYDMIKTACLSLN